jgi:hypothetical protein
VLVEIRVEVNGVTKFNSSDSPPSTSPLFTNYFFLPEYTLNYYIHLGELVMSSTLLHLLLSLVFFPHYLIHLFLFHIHLHFSDASTMICTSSYSHASQLTTTTSTCAETETALIIPPFSLLSPGCAHQPSLSCALQQHHRQL